MNHLRITALVLFCNALFLAGGCSNAASGPQPPASTTPEQQPVGGTTTVAETKYFTGSIGSSLGLQMKLIRRGDELSGSYFYKKIGTSIELRGTIDQGGNVTLEEFDPSGKQTGKFSGKWQADKDEELVTIAGDWSKPDSSSKTPFSLQEQPVYFTRGIDIVAKQIKESNKKLKYELAAEYPELTGPIGANHVKFNREVRALVQKKVSAFKKDVAEPDGFEAPGEAMGNDLGISYVPALANDDLISIEFDVGSYYAGAAHPNSYSEVVNYDLKNGKLLRLSDLFQPGTKYLEAIAAYCIKDLKRQSKTRDSMLDDESIESGAAPKAENYQSWTITRKGLAITFDAYQVGPYAAGPQHVVVPYSIVQNIVNPQGVLAQLTK
ncbi:MAG TPA: RsiV family protein [Pyrinomonadaceae bacterium]|nr:RsiV family protein [Pyrinomonadaceae bacterium]